MKYKTCTVVAFIWAVTNSIPAQTKAPTWLLDKEKEYPSRLFIAAVGEGSSRGMAETQALALISQFFNVKTEVRNEAIREFNEAVLGSATDFSQKTYLTENAVIRFDADFLGIHYGTPWFDSTRDRWSALVYIDRNEALRIYDSKITANMTALEALAADAAAEKEPLYACALLNRSLHIADITEAYISTAAVVESGSRDRYASLPARIQAVRLAHRAQRDGLTFTVTANDVDFGGRIERKIAELLESNGYTVTNRWRKT